MKITKLDTLCLSRMHEPERQWITARISHGQGRLRRSSAIHTDEGLVGIGEASAYGWPRRIREWVDWLGPLLVGRDPRDPSIVPHPNGLSRPTTPPWRASTARCGTCRARWPASGSASCWLRDPTDAWQGAPLRLQRLPLRLARTTPSS